MWKLQKIAIQKEFAQYNYNIAKVFPAFNNTLILSKMAATMLRVEIYHIDAEGKILFKKQNYHSPITANFIMISDRQAAVINYLAKEQRRIDIINLQTSDVTQIPLKNDARQYSYIRLFWFEQTRYLTVLENTFDKNKKERDLVLTFYQRDLNTKQKWNIVIEFKTRLVYTVAQALDKHSKIGFSSWQMTDELQFSYFTLKDNPKGELKSVFVKKQNGPQKILTLYKRKFLQIKQIRPNIYIAFVFEQREGEKIANFDTFPGTIYTIDASDCESEAILKKFNCPCAVDPFIVTLRQFGNSIIVIQKHPKAGVIQEIKLNWVRNDSGELIGQKTISIDKNEQFASCRQSVVILKEHSTDNSVRLKLIVPQFILEFTKAEVSMYFLMHLNEDFDDDLLQDAVVLLQ